MSNGSTRQIRKEITRKKEKWGKLIVIALYVRLDGKDILRRKCHFEYLYQLHFSDIFNNRYNNYLSEIQIFSLDLSSKFRKHFAKEKKKEINSWRHFGLSIWMRNVKEEKWNSHLRRKFISFWNFWHKAMKIAISIHWEWSRNYSRWDKKSFLHSKEWPQWHQSNCSIIISPLFLFMS